MKIKRENETVIIKLESKEEFEDMKCVFSNDTDTTLDEYMEDEIFSDAERERIKKFNVDMHINLQQM